MTAGLHRADLALIGTAATATGVSNAIKVAAAGADVATPHGAALRFLEIAVLQFNWHGVPAYLTPTDLIAVVSAAILLIRFAAWVFAGAFRALKGGWHGGT